MAGMAEKRAMGGALAGFGSTLKGISIRASEAKMRDIEATAAYQRELNLQSLRDQSARKLKEMDIQAQKDMIGARQESALALEEEQYKRGEERAKAKVKETAELMAKYKLGDMWDSLDDAQKAEEIAFREEEIKLAPLLEKEGLSKEAQSELVKSAAEQWDTMDEREKKKRLMKAGGDSAKAYGSFVLDTLRSSAPSSGKKLSPAELDNRQQMAISRIMNADPREQAAMIEDLKRKDPEAAEVAASMITPYEETVEPSPAAERVGEIVGAGAEAGKSALKGVAEMTPLYWMGKAAKGGLDIIKHPDFRKGLNK